MNNLFLTLLVTFLGAAIGGLITIASPQTQKTITNVLLGAAGGISLAWVGYGLAKWDTNRQKPSDIRSQNLPDGSEAAQKPVVTRTDLDEDMGSEDKIKKIYKEANTIDKLTEVSRDLDQDKLEREKDPEKKKRIEIYRNFFSDHNNAVLGEEIGKAALKKYRNQDQFLGKIPDINSSQEDHFCLDISQYLRLIRSSLVNEDYTNLQVPGAVVRHSLSFPEVYEESLKILKSRLPDDIKYQAREEIKDTIDFLIDKISNKKS
ncbi:MAG: hypothetical protein F6K26_24005 [Moorea sp. SIO2I5]|nr:hypothetical protein [Moorena sp. SIO2I5]